MKVDVKEFEELIRKATLNYEIDYVNISFNEDKIKTQLINEDKNAIVVLNVENDVFNDFSGEHEYNFDEPRQNVIPFLRMFDDDEAQIKANHQNTKDTFIKLVADETKVNLFLSQENDQRIFNKTLPKSDIDYFVTLDIDDEFLTKFNKIKKIASSFGKLYFSVRDNVLYLEACDKTNTYSNSIKFDLCEVQKDDLDIMFTYQVFSNLISVLSDEKDYEMKIVYFDNKGMGMIYIISNDEDEKYFLFGKME